ncbi:MAG: V-type ATP synthase subunit D [Candidatus Asgardarchaeia archaeon]
MNSQSVGECIMSTYVKATRMELLELRKKLKLALKGHDLLSDKQDMLIKEFFNIVTKIRISEKIMMERIKKAYKNLSNAVGKVGFINLKQVSLSSPMKLKMNLKPYNVIGMPLYFIEKNWEFKYPYNVSDCGPEVDDVLLSFRDMIDSVIEMAELEYSLILLSEEISRTRRKVNALKNILIPRLKDEISRVEVRLEEMEREEIYRLKKIKGMISTRSHGEF